MEISQDYILPMAIYLDTNMVRKIPFQDSDADYNSVRTLSNEIRAKIFIPEVVAQEFLESKMNEIRNKCIKYKDACRELNYYFNNIKASSLTETVDQAIISHTEIFFRRNGFTKIKVAKNISIEVLVEMAVKRKPPFQPSAGGGGDKGFKDTIILFSIIEHMKENEYTSGIFITEDKVFQKEEIQRILSANGLSLRVFTSFRETKEILSKQIQEVEGEYDSESSPEENSYLLFVAPRFNKVSDYIRANFASKKNVEFLRRDQQGKSAFQGSWAEILDVKPLKITAISFDYGYYHDAEGNLIEPYPTATSDATRIVFKVATQITLLVHDYESVQFLFDYHNPASLSREQRDRILKSELQPLPTKEIVVVREVDVDAKIIWKEKNYDDLEITGMYCPDPIQWDEQIMS